MTTPIIFGVLLRDADEKWLGRNQLMLALSKHTKVVLLEQPHFSGSLFEYKKPKMEQTAANLYIMRNAFGLRYQKIGKRFDKLAARIDGKWFHDVLAQHGIHDYIYWLTVNDPRMALSIPDKRLIYDCMDPNFFPEHQAAFDRSEFALARRAQLTFCSAHTLHVRMQGVNPHSYLLPNAACLDTYQATLAGSTELPELLRNRKRPFIGYMGTLDLAFRWRVCISCCKEPAGLYLCAGRTHQSGPGSQSSSVTQFA